MHAGIAHIHALDYAVAQWPAALDDPSAHVGQMAIRTIKSNVNIGSTHISAERSGCHCHGTGMERRTLLMVHARGHRLMTVADALLASQCLLLQAS